MARIAVEVHVELSVSVGKWRFPDKVVSSGLTAIDFKVILI